MRSDLYQDLYNEEETHWWHISKRAAVRKMLCIFASGYGLRILDVGCGTGKNMEMLSDLGDVWGIDTSAKALSFCKKRGQRHLYRRDAAGTGFPAKYFDVITLLDVLEHTDESKTLPEIFRILKKGGVLILTVPAYAWLWSRWDEVLEHRKRYSKGRLETILTKSGFTVVKSSYMYSFLLLPVYLFRKLKSRGPGYSSDFSANPRFMDSLLSKLASIERPFVVRGLVPFGTSIIIAAKK